MIIRFKYLIIGCISLFLSCSFCDLSMDVSYSIDLINNSGHPIGYYFAHGGKYGNFYPDSLPETNNYVIYNINDVLSPGLESHLSWKEFFKSLPKDTLSVFIFHTDTLNKYPWDIIRDQYKILKRYNLSYQDLKERNWTITYP